MEDFRKRAKKTLAGYIAVLAAAVVLWGVFSAVEPWKYPSAKIILQISERASARE